MRIVSETSPGPECIVKGARSKSIAEAGSAGTAFAEKMPLVGGSCLNASPYDGGDAVLSLSRGEIPPVSMAVFAMA